jgi:transcriptional regulator with XRE-family HTH domain
LDLANRIRSARKAKGMTQEELARRAGVGLNIVNRIERGVVTDPHYSTLSGLAAALDTSISSLVEEPDLAGKAEASFPRPTQGGIGQDIEEVYIAPPPPKSRSADESSPVVMYMSPVEIDISRVVESVESADVLMVSRDALVKALEKVQGGVWSIEEAERALESEAREQLEQTHTGALTGALKQAYTDALEQRRWQMGKWSNS